MTDALDGLTKAARQRRLIIFCGAGVSMLPPSNAPSWWDIYEAATRALGARLAEAYPSLAAKIDVDALLAPLATQELADIVSERFAGSTFNKLLRSVDISDVNKNHRAIAALAKCGATPLVLTTNFDTLIERAAVSLGNSFAVAAPGIPARLRPQDSAVLIKLHGTVLDHNSIIETSTHKARELSPTLRPMWGDHLEGADLLVLGYSGADLNFGAAGAFFKDFLKRGRKIYWAHRPSSKPELPAEVRNRVTFLEGDLPFPLCDIADTLGLIDYETPRTNQDAHAILASSMEDWSKAIHIGKWAALAFYLSAGERPSHAENPILDELIAFGLEEVKRFAPGQALSTSDMGAALFFSSASMAAMRVLKFDQSEQLQRAVVNIFNATDTILQDEKGAQGSYVERQSNLAGAWNNLGHIYVVQSKIEQALTCFQRGALHGYRAGAVGVFVVALQNIIHYGLELKDVRRTMGHAESLLRLADRVGAVNASIELRLLLACYAYDRNEIWIAREWLNEAYRRATATNEYSLALVAQMLLGEGCIRSGEIQVGLRQVASALKGRESTAFILQPVEELRRYLSYLGVPQSGIFSIDLPEDSVQKYVDSIEAERQQARASNSLPWRGKHCSVSPSSAIDDQTLEGLFSIGTYEFDGDRVAAAALSIRYAEYLLGVGQHTEARWVGRNSLLRPDVEDENRAEAHGILARATASLGFINDAASHFEAALEQSANPIALPLSVAISAMWFYVQCEDMDTACQWALLAKQIDSNDSENTADFSTEIWKMSTWGATTQPVVEILTPEGASGSEYGTHPRPYRHFSGATVLRLPSSTEVGTVLESVQELLMQDKPEEALTMLDKLDEQGGVFQDSCRLKLLNYAAFFLSLSIFLFSGFK